MNSSVAIGGIGDDMCAVMVKLDIRVTDQALQV
jgi:hypothetical protein